MGAALALMAHSASAQSQPGEASLRDAAECNPRAGLPRFLSKCEKGESLRIAYFGGSITAQAGWRVQSLELLRKLYPQAIFEEIDASIGGTGSHLGVFRLDNDIIQKKPDLVFVEFATNDSFNIGDQASQKITTQGMEGIVRSLRKALPECEICFVYTLTEPWFKTLQDGKMSPAATAHEGVADRYGIPTIHMGIEIADLEKAGKLAIKSPREMVQQVAGKELDKTSGTQANPEGKIPFSPEGVHPYIDTGHKLYTAAIERSLPKIKEASHTASSDQVPPPLDDGYIQNVSFLPVDAARLEGPWEKVESPGRAFKRSELDRFVPSVWIGRPGAILSFKFKGKSLMLYGISGPASGNIEITLDGATFRRNTFDKYSNYWRLNPFFLPAGSQAAQVHTFSLKVLPDGIEKRPLLAEIKREKDFDENPSAFESVEFVLGGVCIEGGTITEK